MARRIDRSSRQASGKNRRDRHLEIAGQREPERAREKKSFGQEPRGEQRSFQQERAEAELPEDLLIGRNPVMEALRSGRQIMKLVVQKDGEGSIKKIVAMAREKNIPIQISDRISLDRIARGGKHQGVAAFVSEYEYSEVADILQKAEAQGEPPFIIVLDGIEDPHNLGAVIRTADASGAHGVIIPKRRAAAVTAAAERSAAGAASYVPVARVTNISQTIEELKKAGVWIAAVDMDGDIYTEADFTGAVAFVIGSEGFGISRLVKEKCDFTVSIPMKGGVNSLNASNAAAVLMYETVRQRG